MAKANHLDRYRPFPPCPRKGPAHAHWPSRRSGAAGAARPPADPVLQHQLLVLLPPRPPVQKADVAGDDGPGFPLGLRQRPGPPAVRLALARWRAARPARLLLRGGGRPAAPP